MIPAFDHNNVLPPFIGDASIPNSYSPYPCDIVEFCQHFATNPARIAILKGFVRFRLDCIANGIRGRQWIDGDFVENVEAMGNTFPEKILVISMVEITLQEEAERIVKAFPEFTDPRLSVPKYKVDHYVFVTNQQADAVINLAKFWSLFFSHNSRGVWKGMLEMPIYDNDINDLIALSFLNTL